MGRDAWDPFQDLLEVQKRMNRLFEAALTGSMPDHGAGPVGWQPVADIYETGDSVVIELELAGLGRDDIEISVDEGRLVVRGEQKPGLAPESGHFHRLERTYGPFFRQFRLPEAVEPDEISAVFRDGVLTVTLPKRPGARQKAIRVSVD